MKKIFILYLLFSIAFLQAQQTSNRFAEAEAQELIMDSTMEVPPGPPNTKCPDGTEDCPDQLPAHIDDYVPLLLITAIVLILFNHRRQHSTRIIRKF